MSDKIKGITIEIDGDVRKLNDSVKKAASQSKQFGDELRQVERLLKFDPKNVDLIKQKQELLTKSIDHTKQMLEGYKKTLNETNADMANGVKVSQEEYRRLQREIVLTEQKLQGLESAQSDFNSKSKKAADAMNAFGQKTGDLGSKLAPVSAGAAAIVGGMFAATESTREYREDLAKLETNASKAGASLEETKESLKNLNAVTGETDSNVEALSNMLEAGFKGNEMQQALDALSGAVIKFPDTLKIEGLADGLQETLATGKATGSFGELLERMGMSLDGFNEGLMKATESGKEQEYILETLAKTGLSQVSEEYKKANSAMIDTSNAQFDVNDSMADLGDIMEPLVADVLTVLSKVLKDIVDLIKSLDEDTLKTIVSVLGMVAVIAPLLIVMGQLATGIGAIISILPALGGVLAFITGPFGIVIAIVAAVIAIGVTLYKNWDTIKEKAAALYENIKESFAKTRDAIMDPINKAIDMLKDINLFEVGKNIIGGLIDGVTDMIGKVKDAIGDIAETITGGIKKALKIESPSRVMQGLGEYTGEGLIRGIENTRRTLSNVSSGIGNVAIAGTGSGIVTHKFEPLMIKGVNDKNQMVSVVKIVQDELRREVRRR